MSSINEGSQVITYQYQDPAVSSKFNTIVRDFIVPGIYKGGAVTVLSSHTVNILPFVAYIRSNDLSDNQGIRCQTQSAVSQTIPNGPSQTYTIYLTYSYATSPTNYADFNIRLSSAPPVSNEVRICNVTNDGAGLISTVDYTTRMRGTVDVDVNDSLTTVVDPTQDYHVGNRSYNDLRYVNNAGTNNWDVEILNSADGTLSSVLKADITATREWTLQDRDMELADNRAVFQVGDVKNSLAVITPTDLTPWLNISSDYVTLDVVNWSLLVPFLRGLGSTGYVVTGYTPGVSTVLQMDSGNAATAAFVLALYEDNLYHGSGVENYANYKTLTVAVAFGVDIPIGEYNILDIDPIAYTITIDASTVGPTAAGNVNHHPFRIKASSTTARWFRVTDSVIVTAGGSDHIPMFRLRDRIQIHKHNDTGHSHGILGFYVAYVSASPWVGSVFAYVGDGGGSTGGSSAAITDPISTLAPGFDAVRYGNTTRARSLVGYKYMYGGVYTP